MSNSEEILWTAGFLSERFTAPVSPLGWAIVGEVLERYALRDPLRFMGYPQVGQMPATRLVRGHPYTNVQIFQIFYNPFPQRLLPADTGRYFPFGDVGLRKQAPYPRSILNPRLLFSLSVHFLRDPINWSPLNFWQWRRYTRLHDRQIAILNARLDQAKNPQEILQVADDTNEVHAAFAKIHRWSLTYADVLYKILVWLASDFAQALISDVPNLTDEIDSELEQLGQVAARLGLHFDTAESILDARTNPEFAQALGRFLRAHGHRSFSLDIAVPTFQDDPAQFLGLLDKGGKSERASESWLSVRDSVTARIPRWQRPLFAVVVSLARRYAGLREDQRYYWQKSLALSRRAYLALGSYLVSSHVIEEPGEIFYATDIEVRAYFDSQLSSTELGLAIRMRRDAWSNYHREFLESPGQAYPAFLKGDEPLRSEPRAALDSWQGLGISPGQAQGHVRVVLEPSQLIRVAQGEILVAPATDPGWTVVFSRLGALVVERGGVLAHSAIVAREHHVPAVSGISNITRDLVDGDWIEVDGTRGLVRKVQR